MRCRFDAYTTHQIMKKIEKVIKELLDTTKYFNPVNYPLIDQFKFHDSIFQCEHCDVWIDIEKESDIIGICKDCAG